MVNKQTWDVFNEHPSGSSVPKNTGVLKPKARAIALDTGTLAGEGEVLTGEPSADEIDARNVTKGSNVAITRYIRPSFMKHTARVRLNLASPPPHKPAPRHPQIEPADPGEQRPECHDHSLCHAPF